MLLGTQRIDEKGHLEIGGCDTVQLAREFGTPLYVMDEEALRTNCRQYKAAFDARYPQNTIYFAGKAFLTSAVAAIVAQENFRARFNTTFRVESAGLYCPVPASARE